MTIDDFRKSLSDGAPPASLSVPVAALWWDAKGDWSQAHGLVDELETTEGMAVHAYLHRKEGSTSNADYWYDKAGKKFRRESFDLEWTALAEALLASESEK